MFVRVIVVATCVCTALTTRADDWHWSNQLPFASPAAPAQPARPTPPPYAIGGLTYQPEVFAVDRKGRPSAMAQHGMPEARGNMHFYGPAQRAASITFLRSLVRDFSNAGYSCSTSGVNSSWIDAIGWCNNGNQSFALMMVREGPPGYYAFSGVPQRVYSAWLRSPSKGGFFHEHIKDQYPLVR